MHIGMQDSWKSRTVLFLVSQSVTLFGSTLVQMAIIWYVTLDTSSGVWIGAFSVCSYLPEFLISFLGGVWADRYRRKRLIIGADAVIAMVTLVMLLLMPYMADGPLLRALLVMSVLRALGAGIQAPAVSAVIPGLAPADQRMRLNGAHAAMQSAVRFAAPAAAGAVLTVSTLQSTLLIDVLTAALGIGLLSCVRIPWEQKGHAKSSVRAELKAGISYAFSDGRIGRLLILYGLFVFLCVPAGFLAGLLVSRVYGDTYGYLTAAELAGFAGMTAGGLLMSIWGGFKSRKKTLASGLAVFGVMSVLMGCTSEFSVYLIGMILYGMALTTVQTAVTTLLQERTDPSVQGRVFGLLGSIYSGCMPVGMAVFGPLADVISLQGMMIVSGIVLAVAGAGICFDRRF